MIAEAAEANPTCFSPTPLKDLEQTFIPAYIRLVRRYGLYLVHTLTLLTGQVSGQPLDLDQVLRYPIRGRA